MKLTKKKAIGLSVELWEWLAETGKGKWDWPRWEEFGVVESACFLCEYQEQRDPDDIDCIDCPYCKKFGQCDSGSTPYLLWAGATTMAKRKKYAKLLLEQLRELK